MDNRILIIFCILNFYLVNGKSVFLEELLDNKPSCPTFVCENKIRDDQLCFSGEGSMEKGNRKTILNKCPSDGSMCIVNDYFSQIENVTCKKNNISNLQVGYLYPGESCYNEPSSNCLKNKIINPTTGKVEETNECISGRCKGNNYNEKCLNNISCVVGTYCDGYDDKGTLGICKYYKKDGESCNDSMECGFKSACGTIMEGNDKGKKKCMKMNSLKIGQEVDENEGILCETEINGKDTDNKYKCAEIVYDTTKELINNEVVECEYNSDCHYAYRFSDAIDKDVKKSSKKCVCSFSGKGYCQFSTLSNKNRLNSVLKAKEYVAADESTAHNFNRYKEYIKSESYKQYSRKCRNFYFDPLSYNSGICPSVTFDYSECTYIRSKIINTSIFIIAIILSILLI